jgi:hypothetical protein
MAGKKTQKVGELREDFLERWIEWDDFIKTAEESARAINASTQAKGALREKIAAHLRRNGAISDTAVIDFNPPKEPKGSRRLHIVELLEIKRPRDRARDLSFSAPNQEPLPDNGGMLSPPLGDSHAALNLSHGDEHAAKEKQVARKQRWESLPEETRKASSLRKNAARNKRLAVKNARELGDQRQAKEIVEEDLRIRDVIEARVREALEQSEPERTK